LGEKVSSSTVYRRLLKIEIFLKRVSPFDTDVLQNRHNCKNGPVVEPTNFELGIARDRELGN
jgi:hypothetical protein